jgi:hypothetical protein
MISVGRTAVLETNKKGVSIRRPNGTAQRRFIWCNKQHGFCGACVSGFESSKQRITCLRMWLKLPEENQPKKR